MTEFFADWRRFWGESPPLSFALPNDDKWVRLHALPNSKRYPQTPNENALVVHRANAAGCDVLGDDECWLVQAGSVSLGWPPDAEGWRQDYGLSPAGSVLHDEQTWPLFAKRTDFSIGAFDPLFLAIADEKAFRTLWFSTSSGQVFAPYDGGFDLFFKTPEAAKLQRLKRIDWLSSRADGL